MWYDVKILVVDDMPANLEVLTEMLTNAGYGVATAISGERALKRLQTYQPDLILLDVQMPGIDGFDTCQHIKDNPETAVIPIIFMTAFGDIDSKVKAFDLGAVDYITKPFQEKELLARVRTHLQLRQWNKTLEARVAESTHGLQTALDQLKQSQLQLVQAEKMSALGNLMSGIAHEINNPLAFLNGSINHAREYVQQLLEHLALYQQHYPNPNSSIQESAEAIDLPLLCEDLPKVLDSMGNATDRIKAISTSLRTFSRADIHDKISTDIHEGLDSTLLLLKYRLQGNEHRPAIEIVKQYGDIPPIHCFPGQLNQVFMNLLANAIDMFDEVAQEQSFAEIKARPQIITIQTLAFPEQNTVEIQIRDNGKGMTQDLAARIFDHLFTTKSVGKGTGLGLAIARQIIIENHGGSLEVQSEVHQGSTFHIRLPFFDS